MGAASPDRVRIRLIASIVYYILSPTLIWLELISVFPKTVKQRKLRILLLSLPLIVNTLIYATTPLTGALVFAFDDTNKFFRGRLGYTVYYINGFYMFLLTSDSWTVYEYKRKIALYFLTEVQSYFVHIRRDSSRRSTQQ